LEIRTLKPALHLWRWLCAALSAFALLAVAPSFAAVPQRVVIYQAFQSLLYLPLYVGIDKGLFAAHGLEVQKVTANSGAAGVAAVIGGNATFSLQDPMTAVLANLKGADLVNVALVVNGAPVWLVTPGNAKLKTVDDLRGKTIATALPPSTSTYLLERLLKMRKIAARLDTVQIGTEPAPMLAGRADAAALYEPQLDESLAAGSRILYAFTSHYPGGYAFSTIDTARATVKNRPALVQDFVSGLAAAERLMHRSPETALAVAYQEFPTLPKPIIRAAVQRMVAEDVYPLGTTITPQAFANALALQIFIGNIKPGQVAYEAAVDDRFAAKADPKTDP
jgi:NitT/TauT family transport system substrate-binding protein